MELQIGQIGASRQSWHRESMRVLLSGLMEQYPDANEQTLLRKFIELMRENDDYLLAAAEYAVTNTFFTLQRAKEQAKARATPSSVRQTQARELVEDIKEQIILLNLEMPNGKRMRYCTGAEMERFGGAYTKIGRKVGKTKNVGAVLSEKEVRAILRP